MQIYQECKIYLVRSGQPASYGDNERVYEVHFIDYDWKNNPVPMQKFGNISEEEFEAYLVDKAKHLMNVQDMPTRRATDYAHAFDSYLGEAVFIGDGKVRIRIVSPFTD